jgi:hypothetical protein
MLLFYGHAGSFVSHILHPPPVALRGWSMPQAGSLFDSRHAPERSQSSCKQEMNGF